VYALWTIILRRKLGGLSHFFVPICCVFLFPCLSFQVPHTTISYETISVPLFPESKIWFCRLAQYGSEPFSWSQCRSNHGLELQSPECHSHALATDSEQDILYSLNQTPLSNSSHFWIEATEIVWIVVAASIAQIQYDDISYISQHNSQVRSLVGLNEVLCATISKLVLTATVRVTSDWLTLVTWPSICTLVRVYMGVGDINKAMALKFWEVSW